LFTVDPLTKKTSGGKQDTQMLMFNLKLAPNSNENKTMKKEEKNLKG
jgi:hypothetical protein